MTDEHEALDPNVQWIVSEARRPVMVSAEARARLFDAIHAEPRPTREIRSLGWLLRPKAVALPPLATLAAAAGLVGIGLIGGLAYNRDGRVSTGRGVPSVVGQPQLPDSVVPRVVKFVLVAPQATHVSVVGDFNGWDDAATPARKQADGSWTTFVSLSPGRHVYSFIVDGQFISDPSAPIAPDDGYGKTNSVMIVGGRTS
jgi:hypothetical protein